MTSSSNGLMQGKRGLIMGLANEKSLAWGIAQKLAEHGAELAFSYQGEALERACARSPSSSARISASTATCRGMDALDAAFDTLRARWETMDFLVHAIGFSDKTELRGHYVDTSLDNFLMTMNISAYSLVAVTNRARPMMPNGGSILTLTYYGAEKVVPHYNVMGVAKAGARDFGEVPRQRPRAREHPRQRDQRRADQDPRGERDRRLPLHPQVERAQLAAAAQRARSRTSAAPGCTC
jgi:enoyl-[acyl-carrier-protein] reductase (NADH)